MKKILKQCEKSTVESLYLEWIWKRNNCFLMCLVMADFSCRIARNKAVFSCKNRRKWRLPFRINKGNSNDLFALYMAELL